MDNKSMADQPINSQPEKLPLIGILGAGQLSAMMTEAYQPLGGSTVVYGASESDPAASIADHFVQGAMDDEARLLEFFTQADVVTLENEFFDAQLLQRVAEQSKTPLLPEPARFELIEDKLGENRFFQSLGIPVADFFVVEQASDLPDKPGYLKLSKGGYDGIGTLRVGNREEAVANYRKMREAGTVLYEEEINFVKELSLIAVYNKRDLVFYPLVETFQERGVCRFVSYPAQVSEAVVDQAKELVAKVMRELDTVGLFAFELFLTADDELIMNESAPRPHNSGHITLDAMDCSQFENHMRAVAGMDLKEPQPIHETALMVNILATKNGEFDESTALADLQDTQCTVKFYGKKRLRPGRKIGHINLWGPEQRNRAEQILSKLDI